jgi:hypothetical protein
MGSAGGSPALPANRKTRISALAGLSAQISGYLGLSDLFNRALASFSVACADQNERDHAALRRAIREGKVEAYFEENR